MENKNSPKPRRMGGGPMGGGMGAPTEKAKDFKGTVKKLIEEGLIDLTDHDYIIKEGSNFYSKETGEVYDVNKSVRETDLKNGSRIVLI